MAIELVDDNGKVAHCDQSDRDRRRRLERGQLA
jgi:hypothetical protein